MTITDLNVELIRAEVRNTYTIQVFSLSFYTHTFKFITTHSITSKNYQSSHNETNNGANNDVCSFRSIPDVI